MNTDDGIVVYKDCEVIFMKKLSYTSLALVSVSLICLLLMPAAFAIPYSEPKTKLKPLIFMAIKEDMPKKFQEIDKKIEYAYREIFLIKKKYGLAKDKLDIQKKNNIEKQLSQIDNSFEEVSSWIVWVKDDYNSSIANYDVDELMALNLALKDLYIELDRLDFMINTVKSMLN